MLDDVTAWAKESPKRTAAVGGGLLVALIAMFLVLTGGEDVAPVTGTEAGPAVAGNAAAANGQAQTTPQPGVTEQPTADGSAGPAAPTGNAPTASKDDVTSAAGTEQQMNSGVAPVNATGGSGGLPPANIPASNPVTSPPSVASTGRELNAAQERVQGCITAGQGDVFECLRLVKDVVQVERIHEDKPQGATLSKKTADGQQLFISFRADFICRSIGESGKDCNAWTVEGTPSS